MKCLGLSLGLGEVVFFTSRYNHVHYQHPICAALQVSPLDIHWIVHARHKESVGTLTGPVPQSLVAPPPELEGKND